MALILVSYSYIFFLFLGPHCQHMEVPRLGVESELCCQPAPQPQPCRIWAAPVTYTTAHGDAGSLTHWWRPGIKSSSLWILVGFITAESWWEFLCYIFKVLALLFGSTACVNYPEVSLGFSLRVISQASSQSLCSASLAVLPLCMAWKWALGWWQFIHRSRGPLFRPLFSRFSSTPASRGPLFQIFWPER